jgi:hypothetical protein
MTDRDRVVLRNGRSLPLVPPPRDEIYQALEREKLES